MEVVSFASCAMHLETARSDPATRTVMQHRWGDAKSGRCRVTDGVELALVGQLVARVLGRGLWLPHDAQPVRAEVQLERVDPFEAELRRADT